MNKVSIFLLGAYLAKVLVALMAFAPLGAMAQISSKSTAEISLKNAYKKNPKSIDNYLPVIIFERSGSRHTGAPGFRIKLYKDGRGVYQGFVNVKKLGEVDFHLSPEQALEIVDEFSRLGFFELEEEWFVLEEPWTGHLAMEFSVRKGAKIKSVRMDWEPVGAALLLAIEKHVKSEQWRCPYTDQKLDVNSCKIWDESLQQNASNFMREEKLNKGSK